jgi:hypothetical protein
MLEIDYLLNCTEFSHPAVTKVLRHVIFIHHGSIQPCINACSKTEAICPRAITSAFVLR